MISNHDYCRPLYCVCCNYVAPQRHVMAALSLLGIIIMFSQRVCMSIAIISIVEPVHKVNKSDIICPLENNQTTELITITGTPPNKWSEQKQGIIFLMFYVGVVVMSVPSGLLCDRYGSKWMMFYSFLLSSICTVLIPFGVHYLPWWSVPILRFLCGIGQAVMYPGTTELISRWIPESERSTVGALTLSGNTLGTVIGLAGTAYIIVYTDSWTLAFYIWGGIGIIWCIFFHTYVYSYPEIHAHITMGERILLLSKIPKKIAFPIPIFAIISDVCIWAFMVNQFGNDYAYYTITTYLPKYLNNVLNYTLGEIAIYSSIPQIGAFLSSIFCGKIVDYLLEHHHCKIVTIRIIMTMIGTVGPGFCMLFAGYMDCNRKFAIAWFFMALVCKGAFYAGMLINIIDLTQNHTAIVAAIVNGTGALGGVISPYVTAIIAKENTLPQWHLVFWIVFLVCNVCGMADLLFAKGNRAMWDYSPSELLEEEKKEKRPCYSVFSCYSPT